MRGLGSVGRAAAVRSGQGGASSQFAVAAGAVGLLSALHHPSEGGGGLGRVDHIFVWVALLVIALALAVLARLVALRLGQLPTQQHRPPETLEADLSTGSSQPEPIPASGEHKVTEPDSESLVSIS